MTFEEFWERVQGGEHTMDTKSIDSFIETMKLLFEEWESE